jgi:hypothetical protein
VIVCDAVTCLNASTTLADTLHAAGGAFYSWWQLRSTVPLYLAIVAYPLLNFKSPTFFTKFNVFGWLFGDRYCSD